MFLTPENARELESRINERLHTASTNETASSHIRKVSIRAIITALQEYERMKEEHQNS